MTSTRRGRGKGVALILMKAVGKGVEVTKIPRCRARHISTSLLQLPDVELSAAGGVAVGDELDGQPDLALGQVGSAASTGRPHAELLDEPGEENKGCVILSIRCCARHLVRAIFHP